MAGDLFLGLDVGTSYAKGVLATADGHVVARAGRPTDVSRPRPGWAEHDAQTVWWGSFRAIVDELGRGASLARVAAIAVSGLGPTFLPVDAHGRALRPAILYGIDTRATDEIAELERRYGEQAILDRCGGRLTSQSVGPKAAWVRRHEPGVWTATRRFCMLASWLVLRLTGEYVLDHHSASQCLPLYDIGRREWIAERAGEVVPGLQLPRLLWATEVAGTVTPSAAAECGLPAGIPVTAGTIDAWAEAASVDVRAPGEAMLMYGTALTYVHMIAPFRPLPEAWGVVGALPGTWSLAGGVTSSGALTKWLRSLVGDPPWESLLAEAAAVAPGSDGLIVLPYFAGERNPFYDPHARGVLAGLTLGHTRGHLYRALMEGAAYAGRHLMETVAAAVGRPGRLVAVGGGTRGGGAHGGAPDGEAGLWPRIVSDITGCPQELPAETIGASLGDAWLAAFASGAIDAGTRWSRVATIVEPDPANREAYERGYAIFRALYPATADLVHALATSDGGDPARAPSSTGRTDPGGVPPSSGGPDPVGQTDASALNEPRSAG